MNNYDVIIVGAGPGGVFSAYQFLQLNKNLKIAVFDSGNELEKRKCPIAEKKVTSCINCKVCSIMQGFGGAGAYSDGKFNITNDFGGDLYKYIGSDAALELMQYVDDINTSHGAQNTKLFINKNTKFNKVCIQNNLQLLNANVRHLGTDINYQVLKNIYAELKDKVDFYFNESIDDVEVLDGSWGAELNYLCRSSKDTYISKYCIISVGRSGSNWVKNLCEQLDIKTLSNKVDLGVRVELSSEIFNDITDELYESKILYRTQKYEDNVRTFCMNPKGIVVTENTNGLITVNGHSFEDEKLKTDNTNFALLVSKTFTDPFNDSNSYGEAIVSLSNMLGGGVIVQRYGDLIRGRRTNQERLDKNTVRPTLKATPGDLSLVLPKRLLDDIVEMIEALDKVAPGTANPDTLLYGVEVKYYNIHVDVNNNLETKYPGLFIIGDGSGITHSLSHAAASGVYVANKINERIEKVD